MIWYLRIGALLAVLAVGWQVNAWRSEALAAGRLRSELAEVKANTAAALRAQRDAREADQSRALAAARELEALRDVYDRLRALPPAVLVKEIPGENGCPARSLAPDFGVRFDLAAGNAPAP